MTQEKLIKATELLHEIQGIEEEISYCKEEPTWEHLSDEECAQINKLQLEFLEKHLAEAKKEFEEL
jgi:hypothetical protein